MKVILFLFLIILSFSNTAKEFPIFYFEPQESLIIGTLEIQTFPGLPGYENIANGDAIESGWYLKLKAPINVLTRPHKVNEIENNTSEHNVKIIQLVFIDDLKSYNGFLKKGKKVKVFARLFSQQTGHHHTRVLAEVKNIEDVE